MTKEQIKQLAARMRQQDQRIAQMEQLLKAWEEQPRSITQEIDSIPGRRIFYNLADRVTFTDQAAGRRFDPLNFLVSQDGPFIMTHYPLVVWRPTAPGDTPNLGAWRPVLSWPLPDQVIDTDIVDISYELVDGGSQRNFQNEAAGAGPFSRPDNFVPLPVPTLFAPNTTIQFFTTFERILFNSQPAPSEGELAVTLPGYRIVNL